MDCALVHLFSNAFRTDLPIYWRGAQPGGRPTYSTGKNDEKPVGNPQAPRGPRGVEVEHPPNF